MTASITSTLARIAIRAARTVSNVLAFIVATAVLTVAVMVPSIVITGGMHTYSSPMNAGVTLQVDGCTGLGFEYRGNVGFFTDLCE